MKRFLALAAALLAPLAAHAAAPSPNVVLIYADDLGYGDVSSYGATRLHPKDPIEVSYGDPIGDEPTGKAHPELLKLHPSHGRDQTIVNGISRIGTMKGGRAEA